MVNELENEVENELENEVENELENEVENEMENEDSVDLDISDDLLKLLKSFNKLDNYVAKYIFTKYIKNTGLTYKQYLNTIFSVERPAIITQKESLETDLQNMEIADEAYDIDPKNFKVRQYDSLPDIKRCSFIRKHNNKYIRCANCILNADLDLCYKHIDCINMYWDRYCEVLEKIDT